MKSVSRFVASSFIGTHWRGGFTLGVSYWVIGILANFAVFSSATMLSFATPEYDPVRSFIVLLLIWAIAFSASIWVIVGVWRSANNHVARGARAFWALAAQFMMMISVLQIFVVIKDQAAPQLVDAWVILQGDRDIGASEFRLLNNGTEIELLGGITFGSATGLENFLNASSEIRVVHLNSHGGRVQPARQIRDLIRSRGLITVTTRECASACTVAFLGGVQRFIHPVTGRLGFHAAEVAGADPQPEIRQLIEDTVSQGVNRSFAEKAYTTPHSTMWYPDTETLIFSGFVTGLSNGQFALSGFGQKPTFDKVESLLAVVPLFHAMKDNAPDLYQEVADLLIKGIVRGTPEGIVFKQTRTLVGVNIGRYIPTAPDHLLYDFVDMLIDQMLHVNNVDPVVCHNFVFPEAAGYNDPRNLLTEEQLKHESEVITQILLNAANTSTGLLDDKSLHALLEEVLLLTSIYGYEGIDVDLEGLGTTTPSYLTCDATIAFYSAVRDIDHPKSAEVIRFIFSFLPEE